jgi:hypothetical protein
VPYGCKEGHLIGHSRHGGVTRGCSSAESSELNTLRAIWVISFMWSIAVHTTDWGVGACGAFLAGRKGTRMFASVVWAGTNGTAGVVPTKGRGMSVVLTVVALSAPSVWDVVIQLAFPVAYDEILTTDRVLLDVTRQCHDNRGVRFMRTAVCRCQPAWGLSLYQLRIVGNDAVRDLRYRKVRWDSM